MKRDKTRRFFIMIFCIAITVGMVAIFLTTPDTDIDTQQARNIIVQNHLDYTGADNAVSAIYLNFRLWDTLFEALVLLVSAVAVISFSRSE